MNENLIALIVDDSETNRYLLKRQLQIIGINNVYEQDDGLTALSFLTLEFDKQLAQEPLPMVIFLDLNMPNLDGFAFLEKYSALKEEGKCLSCDVIVYSSSDREDDIKKATQHECVKTFLVKGDTSLNHLKACLELL